MQAGRKKLFQDFTHRWWRSLPTGHTIKVTSQDDHPGTSYRCPAGKEKFVCFPVKTAVPALPVAAIRPASVGKPSRSSRQPSGKSKKYTYSSITSSAPQSPGSSPPCQPAGLSGDAEKQYISRETICYSFAKQRGADSCKLSAPCFLSYCPGSFPRTYFSGLWYLHYPAIGVLPAAPLDAVRVS